MTYQTIIFGGGCFWCTEAVFRRLKGVISVTPGYASHAEVIRVEFDPSVVDLQTLLSVFFAMHDPTTPDRQGNDVGAEYRSLILYIEDGQADIIHSYISKLAAEHIFSGAIVTEVGKLDSFHEAEEYHKEFYERNKEQPYCQFVIDPKLAKLRKQFSHLLEEQKKQ